MSHGKSNTEKNNKAKNNYVTREVYLLELIKATEKDGPLLSQFYFETEVPGPIHYKVKRVGSFFDHYRQQSEKFSTYFLKNPDGQIEASASFIFRPAVVDGKLQNIGYATDLRVSPTRRAVLTWSQHFLPVLEAERAAHDCQFVFTTVPESQKSAYNAFVRPRGLRREMPRYFLFRKFKIVSLHGLWPFHAKPLHGINVQHVKPTDWDALSQYIYSHAQRRPLHYFPTPESILENLKQWSTLNKNHFLLAKDRKDKIIGCLAPWNPKPVQELIVQNYDNPTKNLQDILRIFSMFRFSHALPKENSPLSLQFLTHNQADNPDIFYSLLYHAYMNSKKEDVLLYPHYQGELHTVPPRSFISGEMDQGFYCVLSPTDPIPDFLKPSSNYSAPMFEPAFI
jgi:hypothetical protein